MSLQEHLIYLPAHLRWLALRFGGKRLRIEVANLTRLRAVLHRVDLEIQYTRKRSLPSKAA